MQSAVSSRDVAGVVPPLRTLAVVEAADEIGVGRVAVPALDVDDQVGGRRDVKVDFAAGADGDLDQVGHRSPGGPVEVGCRRPRQARGIRGEEACARGIGHGYVQDDRAYASGRHAAVPGDLEPEGGSCAQPPDGDAAGSVPGVEQPLRGQRVECAARDRCDRVGRRGGRARAVGVGGGDGERVRDG